MFDRVLIVGASRGLGRAVALYLGTHLEKIHAVHLMGRKMDALEATRAAMFQGDSLGARIGLAGTPVHVQSSDLSTPNGQDALCDLIEREGFDLVIFTAGGGPHGEYVEKDWKDHKWALEVNLISPLRAVHVWLRARHRSRLGRFVVVGSRIAEDGPDPLASTYAASKHGLVGFVSSIRDEDRENENKVWLFSPGYMDTEMLPPTAKVRHDGVSKIMSVETAAQTLLRWVKNKEGAWRRVLN